MNGYRFYFDKNLEYLFNEEKKKHHIYFAMRYAKKRLRMYANLFNRDMRKVLISKDSVCINCNSIDNLQLDHIIPIDKGGKNLTSNIQILCRVCNREKSNKDQLCQTEY